MLKNQVITERGLVGLPGAAAALSVSYLSRGNSHKMADRVSLRRYYVLEGLFECERKSREALQSLYQISENICSLYMRQASTEELCEDALDRIRSEIRRLDPQRIVLLRRIEELETQRRLKEEALAADSGDGVWGVMPPPLRRCSEAVP